MIRHRWSLGMAESVLETLCPGQDPAHPVGPGGAWTPPSMRPDVHPAAMKSCTFTPPPPSPKGDLSGLCPLNGGHMQECVPGA